MTILMKEVAALQTQAAHLKASFGAKPFLPSGTTGSGPVPDPAESAATRAAASTSLPLKLGPMGPLATGRIFDNKIAGQTEFQFSSH